MRLKFLLLNFAFLLYPLPAFAQRFSLRGGGSMEESTFFIGVVIVSVCFVLAFAIIFLVQTLLTGAVLFTKPDFLKLTILPPIVMVIAVIPPCLLNFMVSGVQGKSNDTLKTLLLIMILILVSFLYFYILNILFDLFSDKPLGKYMAIMLAVLSILLGLVALVNETYLAILLLVLSAIISNMAHWVYLKTKARLFRKMGA